LRLHYLAGTAALVLLACASIASGAEDGSSAAKIERNKRVVIQFYNALMQGDVDTLKKLGRPDYKQHNPAFGDSLQGLIDRIHERPARPAGSPPMPPLQFVRVVAEGDFVVLLRRMGVHPGEEPTLTAEKANVDFFRVQDGKVAEHWDYQEVFPRGSDAPKNNNGRF
jgi:predicted SnoaL-like aldol condensation-catalyzing enzyme